jgi:hypothetical protein
LPGSVRSEWLSQCVDRAEMVARRDGRGITRLGRGNCRRHVGASRNGKVRLSHPHPSSTSLQICHRDSSDEPASPPASSTAPAGSQPTPQADSPLLPATDVESRQVVPGPSETRRAGRRPTAKKSSTTDPVPLLAGSPNTDILMPAQNRSQACNREDGNEGLSPEELWELQNDPEAAL